MVRWVHVGSVVKAPLYELTVSHNGPQERNPSLTVQRAGVDVPAMCDKELKCFTRRAICKVWISVMEW